MKNVPASKAELTFRSERLTRPKPIIQEYTPKDEMDTRQRPPRIILPPLMLWPHNNNNRHYERLQAAGKAQVSRKDRTPRRDKEKRRAIPVPAPIVDLRAYIMARQNGPYARRLAAANG